MCWLRVAPRQLLVAGSTAPAGGAAAPKRNKRGKRSKEKQEERVQRGIQKRLEALQERAEAQYPELVGQASSPRGSASGATRTVVLQEDPKKEGVRLVPNPNRPKKRRAKQTQPKGSIRLKSAAPERQERTERRQFVKAKYSKGKYLIGEGKREWKKHRFHQRRDFVKDLRPFIPRRTVGDWVLEQNLPPDCSSCDERKKKQRPFVLAFASQVARKNRAKAVIPQRTPLLAQCHALKKPETKETQTLSKTAKRRGRGDRGRASACTTSR